MGNKKILFIGPTYMDIYKDIVEEFQREGNDVDFIKERSCKNDPLNVRREYYRPTWGVNKKKERYWINILSLDNYNKVYDILFVVDGQGLHPILFEILKKRNPNILCVNYLFDTIQGVYHFESFFPYYDKVYTFDLGESKKYNINWLPIYWVRQEKEPIKYDMFGFGAFTQTRYNVFKKLYDYSINKGLNSYIGISAHINREWFYVLRKIVSKPLGLHLDMTLEQYHSSIVVQNRLSPPEFRRMIGLSKIVIDTHPVHQDGLTARFMWALGERKKVITTNRSIVEYDFYSPLQIYIIDENPILENISKLESFINSDLILSEEIESEIDKYRIDNWLKTMCF